MNSPSGKWGPVTSQPHNELSSQLSFPRGRRNSHKSTIRERGSENSTAILSFSEDFSEREPTGRLTDASTSATGWETMEGWREDNGQRPDHRGGDPSQHHRDLSPHRHPGDARGKRGRRSPRSPRRVTQDRGGEEELVSPRGHSPRPHRSAGTHSPRRQNDRHDQSPRRQVDRRSPNRSPRRGGVPPVTPRHQPGAGHHRQPPQQRSRTQRSLRYTRGRRHKRGGHDPRHHYFDDSTTRAADDETTTARLEVFSIVLQFVAIVASLMVAAPMAMVASRWEYRRERCPLFVEVPPGFSIHWGNEDLTSCKLTAFLPIVVLLLSGTMLLSHCGLLHVWRTKGDPPPFAFSRLYSLITLAIAFVQTLLALSIAITLTEGFRQTCIAFDLNLSWNEVAYSCKENYDDRDEAYGLGDLRTFNKIVTGLAGSWTCSITTILITIVYMLRARICWCQLVCI